MDQIFEISVTANYLLQGNMSTTMQGIAITYLQKNEGLVKQKIEMDMNMNGKITENGVTLTMNSKYDLNGELTLGKRIFTKQQMSELKDLSPQQKFMLKAGFMAIQALLLN